MKCKYDNYYGQMWMNARRTLLNVVTEVHVRTMTVLTPVSVTTATSVMERHA